MSPADRKVALHAFDLLWDATENRDWDRVKNRLRLLLPSRVMAGPWDAQTVAGLTYCYLFAEYIPQLTGESIRPFERSRFERWLLSRPDLTRKFLFALTDVDRVGPAVGVLYELYGHSANTVARYPDLAAAMAIVFDRGRSTPEQRQDTFDWLTSPRVESAYGIRRLPHELARYLVDMRVSRRERVWAYQRYRKARNLDNVYRDVEYDRDALTGKRPRQLSGKEYTLMNLQAYGGTCGDQAYYATQVGRTLGYPVARINHQGPGIVGHCWCLQLSRVHDEFFWREVGGRGFGWVVDPATGRKGTDQTLGFLMRSMERGPTQRELAAALTRVALRIPDWVRQEVPAGAEALRALTTPSGQRDAVARTSPYYTVERRLEPLWVLRKALQADAHNTAAWAAVESLGRRGRIAPDELAALLDKLASLTGRRYADVLYFALLAAHSKLPPEHERRFIEAARESLTAEQVERAPELAADLFILAGDLLAAEGKSKQALKCYDDAIDVDPEFPPSVIRAVQKALPIAKETGDVDRYGDVCQRIFERTRDPKYGLEIGRIIVRADLPERAVRWLRHVYDRSEGERPGRFDSLRLAIELLAGMDKHASAAEWCLELYNVTTHPSDGRRLVELLRAAGKKNAAARMARRVEENERQRMERVAQDAARRAAQTR
jgi:tetratricopeptide (TPR) repeat protein